MTARVINGSEAIGTPDTPVAALTLFYRAFNDRDLVAMAESWDTSGDIAMFNPIGGVRRGWDAIAAGYQKIFTGAARVYVEFYDIEIVESGDLFVAHGRERGWLRDTAGELPLAIRTSRVFARRGGRWRQIHHHGSIEDARLLAAYQQRLGIIPASA